MIQRPDGLALRRSLREAMGDADAAHIESTAVRQERTIDAILRRLYSPDPEQRREMVLLADEVGLGKTFVALGVAWSVLYQRAVGGLPSGPVLVVTPTAHALFRKWRREAERFVQLIAPRDMGFEVVPAETPHDLVSALRRRRPTLVIARMSAFNGQLHRAAVAWLSVVHALLRMEGCELTLDQRVELLADRNPAPRERLSLHASNRVWSEALETPEVRFGQGEVQHAFKRMQRLDEKLCARLLESCRRVQTGRPKRASFWADLRELCRASLGQTIPHKLPLIIIDEIHGWKNHPTSWSGFLHTLGGRTDRLLGLSATPFQLGTHELIKVLELRRCIDLPAERDDALRRSISLLKTHLESADEQGKHLRDAWGEIEPDDIPALEQAWSCAESSANGPRLPSRLERALIAARQVQLAHGQLAGSLRPFVIRHRRDVSHRAWWIGRDARADANTPSATGSALRWRPGLDIGGDAELVHYLMMRAVQEEKQGRGATSLGADLGGSYDFFRDGELRRLLPGSTPTARQLLSLVEQTLAGGHEHPKVGVTAERAFRAWRHGEKTLVFCFNIKTVAALQTAIRQRVEGHNRSVLMGAFDCSDDTTLERRLKNFQARLYDYRQSLFLLFQDYPLTGPDGRLPRGLALNQRDLQQIAECLALSGLPRDRSRFDRRRVLAAAEQVLVGRWRETVRGQAWLDDRFVRWRLLPEPAQAIALILSPDWVSERRRLVEGVKVGAEIEPLPDEAAIPAAGDTAASSDIRAWLAVLEGQAGRATLVPYLSDRNSPSPSLLMRMHAPIMARLPAALRSLAARMLRRMVRSPGFLARFLLDDPKARPGLEDDEDSGWSERIQLRYQTPPPVGESARQRFDAYLTSLEKARDLPEQIEAYDEASGNRDVVTRVTGSVDNRERDRLFTGFNTPLVPEILIVTTVGQEGIDLHRECRHVIHHDLPWNPADLEQRTGRVDRIGSKADRIRANGNGQQGGGLDVVVPYIAGTYDEHRFRVVHGRAHLFEITMGGDYVVDGHRTQDAEAPENEAERPTTAWTPVPERIAEDLRLSLAVGDYAGPGVDQAC